MLAGATIPRQEGARGAQTRTPRTELTRRAPLSQHEMTSILALLTQTSAPRKGAQADAMAATGTLAVHRRLD